MRALLSMVCGLLFCFTASAYDVSPHGRFELSKSDPTARTGKAGVPKTGIFCAEDGQRFIRPKTWPSFQDRIVLTFDSRSQGRGVVDYQAVHEGLTGGDCKIEFRSDFEVDGQKIVLKPIRSTFKDASEYSTPCKAITVDQTRSFGISLEKVSHSYGMTEILKLEGADTTGLCPVKNSTVLFVFSRVK